MDGFVVDGEQITHIVLEHGHLWGRRDLTVPIGAVTKVETDAVTLSLSKDEVGAPSVSVRRWDDREFSERPAARRGDEPREPSIFEG